MEELWLNDLFVTFDGTVLEIFGFIMTAKTETGARYHVRNLQIDVEGPDRKGRHTLRFNLARNANFGSVTEISEDDWATVGPFIDRVNAAIAAQT